MRIPEICRYCGSAVIEGNIRDLYGTGNQKIYYCVNCNAFVTCHKDTGQPMGKLANFVLRTKRRVVHKVFDSFWKKQGWSRTQAYRWLALSMSLPGGEAHIGNFEMDECEQVIRLCRSYERQAAA